uniref:Uncharacterized protein n=1 Tax=Steinernema glaseri TaxID=37863 RepID=A0A1I7Y2R8_9BILA
MTHLGFAGVIDSDFSILNNLLSRDTFNVFLIDPDSIAVLSLILCGAQGPGTQTNYLQSRGVPARRDVPRGTPDHVFSRSGTPRRRLGQSPLITSERAEDYRHQHERRLYRPAASPRFFSAVFVVAERSRARLPRLLFYLFLANNGRLLLNPAVGNGLSRTPLWVVTATESEATVSEPKGSFRG